MLATFFFVSVGALSSLAQTGIHFATFYSASIFRCIPGAYICYVRWLVVEEEVHFDDVFSELLFFFLIEELRIPYDLRYPKPIGSKVEFVPND